MTSSGLSLTASLVRSNWPRVHAGWEEITRGVNKAAKRLRHDGMVVPVAV